MSTKYTTEPQIKDIRPTKLAGSVISAVVSFVVGSALLNFGCGSNDVEPDNDGEVTKREEAVGG